VDPSIADRFRPRDHGDRPDTPTEGDACHGHSREHVVGALVVGDAAEDEGRRHGSILPPVAPSSHEAEPSSGRGFGPIWWQGIDAWIGDEQGAPETPRAAAVSDSPFDDDRRDQEDQPMQRSRRPEVARLVLALLVAALLIWFALANSQHVTVD